MQAPTTIPGTEIGHFRRLALARWENEGGRVPLQFEPKSNQDDGLMPPKQGAVFVPVRRAKLA